jgi:hypothetical protein
MSNLTCQIGQIYFFKNIHSLFSLPRERPANLLFEINEMAQTSVYSFLCLLSVLEVVDVGAKSLLLLISQRIIITFRRRRTICTIKGLCRVGCFKITIQCINVINYLDYLRLLRENSYFIILLISL